MVKQQLSLWNKTSNQSMDCQLALERATMYRALKHAKSYAELLHYTVSPNLLNITLGSRDPIRKVNVTFPRPL